MAYHNFYLFTSKLGGGGAIQTDPKAQLPGGYLADLRYKFSHILTQDIYIRTLGNSNDLVFLSQNFETQNKYFKTFQLLVTTSEHAFRKPWTNSEVWLCNYFNKTSWLKGPSIRNWNISPSHSWSSHCLSQAENAQKERGLLLTISTSYSFSLVTCKAHYHCNE